ncbi:MAG: hypothetical protein FH748_11555 [Balneolaceae bacterium]|nr:hypothetical protein [Balneolaceae bacterium]
MNIFKITGILLFLIILFCNLQITSDSYEISFTGEKAYAHFGEVTCYSMYESDCGFFEDCSNFYDCGPCTMVDNFSDWQAPGHCAYTQE